MKKEAIIQKVKDVLMVPVMVIGNILIWGGLNIVLFGWLIAKIISGESSIGAYEIFGALVALLIGGYLNYLYWFKYKSFKKTETEITQPITTENSPDIKTNQPKNIQSFWRRLTWGFLPEGFRRIALVLPFLYGIKLAAFVESNPFGLAVLVVTVIMVWIAFAAVSLLVSWIVDGFKKH